MENEHINSKILEVWKTYRKESGIYHPILYPDFKKEGILFIGLNPSFSEKAFRKILNGTEYQEVNIIEKLKRESNDFDFLIFLEKRAIDVYNYFVKFQEISKSLDLECQYIDLFYFRETTQNEAKERIRNYDKANKAKKFSLNDFGISQLRIALEMIKEINPKLIVVANAFASDIINNFSLFKITDKNFRREGYDTLEIDNKQIPIFFSSMLSGQRALDTHSFRRLKWQIKRVFDK
ncbi:MAG TPA: hypothetical protein VMW67_06425 [Desulfobacteria bacterium]|nr:hypothetical protein [Desulfobacteria bacterium]